MIKWPGFRVRFHPLFTILMLLSAMTGFFVELLTLFGIVLIHEFGHVAAARSFGWKIREISLLPFGGVAAMEDSGNVPSREEVIVALAGPLQNVMMILFAYVMKTWGFQGNFAWWDYFITANVLIGSFNLLPILPLDGGKLLQAGLGYVLQYHHAMLVAVISSLLLSAAMIVISCIFWGEFSVQLNMLMIGIFLFYSNWYEYRNISYRYLRFLIGRHRQSWQWLGRGTLAQPIVVYEHRKIAEILKMLMREKYHLIYVLNKQGKICGVFTEQRMIDAYLHEKKVNSAVSELLV